MTLRNALAAVLLALLPMGLSGCLFDQPLTGITSTNIDSRLLGVFEFRKGGKKDRKRDDAKPDDETEIQRLAVMPLDANRYVIYYRDFSKKPAQTMKFIGWISRVDSRYYISFRDETEGSSTFGKYGFFRFEWEFPGNFLLYAPDAQEFQGLRSPYAMRAKLRRKLKAGTAFPFEATYWQKIARVWWNPLVKAPRPNTEIPPEFENGTTFNNPGL